MQKVADLEGALLDYWVARAGECWEWAHNLFPTMTLDPTFKGVELFTFEGGRTVCRLVPTNPFRQDFQIFEPSTRWAHGGAVIERECVAFLVSHHEGCPPALRFTAFHRPGQNGVQGPTHLVAAMRALVASKYGEEGPETGE